ncbi:hypothetical protein R1sor_004625 [Riccia sorocarpa]|uniref:Reverse transcriptase domain-containing protein n=1 Tax=Riccia sorocarpa TaxID=122646 RepID=A0ABD3HKQ4_9MARC
MAKKRLLKADMQGVIKLILKGGDKKLLSNWRPISLMSLTYKIVSKLLANRIKLLMPFLVDAQQTGFISGRQITDNILSVKLGQEWARWTEQPAISVKLDFVKAYDRVDHTFLWSTLECMGFDRIFIGLVQGMTCGGTALVHVNRRFTEDIKVERGVRQGCPLAPLLFALSSQPLLSMLANSVQEGSIKGIDIEPGHSLVHQLYADDTGVCLAADRSNFSKLQEILSLYEKASGAHVNLQKSLIMPFGCDTVPDWVRMVRCEVIEGEQSFKYLGIRLGVALPAGIDVTDVIRRMKNQLCRWENVYLPWASRLILIKHVLSLISMHIMLTIRCQKADSKRLESLCRDFVWCVTDEGRPKKAIVAWRRLAQEKLRGGVGIRPFADRAQALQMRHACSILEGKDVEWVRIARRIMLTKLHIGPQKRERSGWDCSDAMLLLSAWRMPDIPTLDKILKTWFCAKKFLRFDSSHLELPDDLPVRSFRVIWALQEKPETEGFTWAETEARRNKILTVGELVTNVRVGGGVAQILTRTFPDLLSWLVSLRTSVHKLVEGEGWMWFQSGRVERGWSASASFWLKLFGDVCSLSSKLNGWWNLLSSPEDWSRRWKALWSGHFFMRQKLWVWWILQHGFPTLERAKKWGVFEGFCLFCLRELETTEHMFWFCPSLRQRTSWIGNLILGDRCGHPTLIQILDECLRDHKRAPAKFFLLVAHSKACWKERNLLTFEGKRSRQSQSVILAEIEAQGKAFCFNLRGEKREQLMESFQSFVTSATISINQTLARQADVADILRALGNYDTEDVPIWLQVLSTGPAVLAAGSSSSYSNSSSDSENDDQEASSYAVCFVRLACAASKDMIGITLQIQARSVPC